MKPVARYIHGDVHLLEGITPPPDGSLLYAYGSNALSRDGSVTVKTAIEQVMALFPGSDKLALETLANALTKPSSGGPS